MQLTDGRRRQLRQMVVRAASIDQTWASLPPSLRMPAFQGPQTLTIANWHFHFSTFPPTLEIWTQNLRNTVDIFQEILPPHASPSLEISSFWIRILESKKNHEKNHYIF